MLSVITGPMFSGKTTRLLNFANNVGTGYQLFKPHLDDRYSHTEVCSHVGKSLPATVIKDSFELIPRASVTFILIDEGQFFDFSLPYRIEQLLKLDYQITVAGLDMDYKGRPFDPMGQILAMADKVEKLKSECYRCGCEAGRTFRLTEGEERVMVGGSETYAPICFKCSVKEKEDE